MTSVPFAPLGRPVSRLVLGSMVFHTDTLEHTFGLLDAWRAHGGNCVDTAHLYAGGASERALGAYLRDRGDRDYWVILTKGAHHNADRPRVTPEDITCDLRDSLARLQTDYVDLYLLHRDDPQVPVGELVDALNRHHRAGRIRAFGGSNWSPARLEAANAYAAAHGLQGFTVGSPQLSLAVPSGEIWAGCLDARDPETLEWYRRTGMALFAWSSQARGFFSGRFRPETLQGTPEDEFIQRVFATPDNWERLRRAEELGARRACSATQVALAWLLHLPAPVFPLVGPATVEELDACARAADLRLTPAEVAWLDLRAAQPGPPAEGP
jgi:aryl-alcohol dehydrogenase-like predicted oxidoreductase